MAQYVHKVNGKELAAAVALPGSPLAEELAVISAGAFRIVPLKEDPEGSGNMVPAPENADPPVPLSEKIIYLTRDDTAGLKDPYDEWIYFKADPQADPPVAAHWEIIGTTALDLDDYKKKQTPVSATGTTVQTVTTVSQNANGEISITISDIRSASTSQTGIVQLKDSISSGDTEDGMAVTPHAVSEELEKKADKIEVVPGEEPTGHIPELDQEGNLVDSEIDADSIVTEVKIDGEQASLVSNHMATIPKAEPTSASTAQQDNPSEWGVVSISTIEI